MIGHAAASAGSIGITPSKTFPGFLDKEIFID
jgi:hypothetical protein